MNGLSKTLSVKVPTTSSSMPRMSKKTLCGAMVRVVVKWNSHKTGMFDTVWHTPWNLEPSWTNNIAFFIWWWKVQFDESAYPSMGFSNAGMAASFLSSKAGDHHRSVNTTTNSYRQAFFLPGVLKLHWIFWLDFKCRWFYHWQHTRWLTSFKRNTKSHFSSSLSLACSFLTPSFYLIIWYHSKGFILYSCDGVDFCWEFFYYYLIWYHQLELKK